MRVTASRDGARVYAAVMGPLPASAGSDLRVRLPAAAPPPQPVHVLVLER